MGWGAVFQLMASSLQELETSKTLPPSGLLSVTNNRSFAEFTGPVNPAKLNCR